MAIDLIREIRQTRLYTEEMLKDVPTDDWFQQPAEGVTHVAWQVGHLAYAQYSLALRRIRGEKVEDSKLISTEFRQLFGKGSEPTPDPTSYPTPAEIREVFDRVHQQVLCESGEWSEELLSEASTDPPHPMFDTKMGSLCWSVQHEFIHAGQIGLLRRLFGSSPLR